MSTISDLIKSRTTVLTAAKAKPKAKPEGKKPPTTATAKSMGGLTSKLSALEKKYPGVKLTVIKNKTKKNYIKVSGLKALAYSDMIELFEAIPNTSHIPQRQSKSGTAIFALFGVKELTGSDVTKTPFAILTAKGDVERGKFLSVLMKACSGDEGKKLVAAFNDKDADAFNALWADVSGKITAALTASDLTLSASSSIATLIASKGAVSKEENPAHKPIRMFASESDKKKIFFRSSNAPGKRAIPLPWHSKQGYVVQGEFVATDGKNAKVMTPEGVIVVPEEDISNTATPPAATVTAALTDPTMIDMMVMRHVGENLHKDGFISKSHIMDLLDNVSGEDLENSLGRLKNGGSVTMDGDKIYPSADMQAVLASTSTITQARQYLRNMKKKAEGTKTPQAKAAHLDARRKLALALKKAPKIHPVAHEGVLKPSRSATVTASTTQSIITDRKIVAAEDEKELAKHYHLSNFSFHLSHRDKPALTIKRAGKGYNRKHAFESLKKMGMIPKGYGIMSASGKAVRKSGV